MTDLDYQLRDMALKNWEQFVAIVGSKAVMRAKMCLMHKAEISYGGIVNRLGVTVPQVRHACKTCPDDE